MFVACNVMFVSLYYEIKVSDRLVLFQLTFLPTFIAAVAQRNSRKFRELIWAKRLEPSEEDDELAHQGIA